MRRLIAGLAQRLRLRPRPRPDDEAPTGRARTVQRDQTVQWDQTVQRDQTVRPDQTARAGSATRTDQAARSRPPVPRQRTRVVTTPPTRGRQLVYAPELDGRADPGEIVWTWVPYEDDPAQGKDRPVLVVGRDGSALLGLMLSSNTARDGQRHWHALGSGAWDRQQRPSWVRLDRIIVVDEDGIRREGDVLAKPRFEAIAAVLRADYGWR